MNKKGLVIAIALTIAFSNGLVNKVIAAENANKPASAAAQTYYQQAIKASIDGKVNQAIKNYLKVIKIEPNFAMAYNNLGYQYAKKGNNKRAINHYKKALYIKPDDSTFHTNLAAAYEKIGQINLAIDEYIQALNIDKDSTTVQLALEKALKKKAQKEGKSLEQVKNEVSVKFPGETLKAFEEMTRYEAIQGKSDEE